MQTRAVSTLIVTILLATGISAKELAACRVEPFQGATTQQGAVAEMTVTNSGASCSITNYGVPAGRINPSESGAITSAPTHGRELFGVCEGYGAGRRRDSRADWLAA